MYWTERERERESPLELYYTGKLFLIKDSQCYLQSVNSGWTVTPHLCSRGLRKQGRGKSRKSKGPSRLPFCPLAEFGCFLSGLSLPYSLLTCFSLSLTRSYWLLVTGRATIVTLSLIPDALHTSSKVIVVANAIKKVLTRLTTLTTLTHRKSIGSHINSKGLTDSSHSTLRTLLTVISFCTCNWLARLCHCLSLSLSLSFTLFLLKTKSPLHKLKHSQIGSVLLQSLSLSFFLPLFYSKDFQTRSLTHSLA